MKNVSLDVQGMKCESCVATVTEALENFDGVHEANVSLAASEAHVAADDGVDAEALAAAVESAGFEATPRT